MAVEVDCDSRILSQERTLAMLAFAKEEVLREMPVLTISTQEVPTLLDGI
jgi:hypothetical protein